MLYCSPSSCPNPGGHLAAVTSERYIRTQPGPVSEKREGVHGFAEAYVPKNFFKLWQCPGASFYFFRSESISHMWETIKEYVSHLTCINSMLYNEGKKVDIFSGDCAGEKLCWHQDSNPRPFNPVVLHLSHTFLTSLGPFWLARSGPSW